MAVLLVGAAITFVVAAWVYAWLTPNVPKSVERALELVFLLSSLGLAAIATIVALAHI